MSVSRNAVRAQPVEITGKRQLAALASPIRQEILNTIESIGPCKVHEIAAELGRPADGLYYHLRALEKLALVQRGERAPSGGRAAVVYDVPGRPMRVQHDPGDPAQRRAADRATAAMLRLGRRDFARALEQGIAKLAPNERNAAALRLRAWWDERQLAQMRRLLDELARLALGTRRRPGARAFAISLVYCPLPEHPRRPVPPSEDTA